jgi:hypothetical protein
MWRSVRLPVLLYTVYVVNTNVCNVQVSLSSRLHRLEGWRLGLTSSRCGQTTSFMLPKPFRVWCMQRFRLQSVHADAVSTVTQ